MKCNNSASFPLSAETAIFALAGQKIGGSRCKFLWNFNFLRLRHKKLGAIASNCDSPFYYIFSLAAISRIRAGVALHTFRS